MCAYARAVDGWAGGRVRWVGGWATEARGRGGGKGGGGVRASLAPRRALASPADRSCRTPAGNLPLKGPVKLKDGWGVTVP